MNKQFADRFQDRNYNVNYRLTLAGAPVVQGDSAQVVARRTVETTYGKLRSTAGPTNVTIHLQKIGGHWIITDMQ